MVYVINKNNKPLMPCSNRKARLLLKQNKAIVIKRTPFTIKLKYGSSGYVQPISLGVDAGSKHIGLSATTKDKVLFESDVELRNDISDLLLTRRQNRRTRRNRKTRYRQPRFNNRTHSKHKGWLAPSIENKINSHLVAINRICKILPITNIVVEVAQFDTQLLKAIDNNLPIPQGTDYQQGELLGFANLREFCFFRDNYTCMWCKGKSKNKILHMHHWNFWNGDHSNKPSSVITLCDTCNDSKNHKKDTGFLWGWTPKITKSYKDSAFMGIMRWTFYNRLKEMYPMVNVKMTYGYITKNTRIKYNLPKEHYIDARCISGNPNAKSIDNVVYYQKKVRCHNRQIHKNTILKGGYRKSNQAPKYVFGYQLFDKVLYNNKECFIFGRRSSGSFDIRLLDGTKISAGISYKKLKLLEKRKSYLIERRIA